MLNEQIREFQEKFLAQAPKEVVETIFESTKKMIDDKLAQYSIQHNEILPNGKLLNFEGKEVFIKDIVKSLTVISFYRGSWCPYCNLELKALQDYLPQFKSMGADLIAISPEKPDGSLTFKEKLELEFDVFTDTNNEYAKQLGLVFRLEDHINEIYKEFGFDLKETNGIDTQELPFPATLIVDANGKVLYSFIKEDYTMRCEPSEILKQLEIQKKRN